MTALHGKRPGERPRVRVLIVDDSALMRRLLREVLSQDESIEVVAVASDALIAWEKIQLLQPDVLTLDVEMPKMDGLTFLKKLMRAHPMPVLMVSALTEKGCTTTLRALELGAVDFIAKPKIDVVRATCELGDLLIQKVKAVARAKVRPGIRRAVSEVPARRKGTPRTSLQSAHWVIAMGASTGGTEALHELLAALPVNAPGIVVVQHMPEGFTRQFAQRLDAASVMHVKEACPGDRVLPGQVLIAPGNQHMEVVPSGLGFAVSLNSNPPVGHHRPSVDVLFESCARHVRTRSIGVLLTGMGADGARGMLAMRRAGARTIAQDEASSVVFGMPGEAIANGSVEVVAPLERIASALLDIACIPLGRC